jgi:tetratricopeptide (TPR) repeat protein
MDGVRKGRKTVATLGDQNLRSLVADAVSHHRAGRLNEAEAAYHAALEISPGYPAIIHNVGLIAAVRGEHSSAIKYFDQAIATNPRYVAAYFNRGVAHQLLGHAREAIESFSRVTALDPANYDAHRALGFLWLAQRDRGRALDHFARTYELRRGEDRVDIATGSLNRANRGKLRHDAEQFRFLARCRRDGDRFDALARAYEAMATDFPEMATRLSDNQLDRLGGNYNTPIYMGDAPELPGRALDRRTDVEAITRRFNDGPAGGVWFDDLLTPLALQRLKQYLLESTIWHDFSHIDGFVASYLEDGLACPLLLQIADEIREAFPALLQDRPLTQAWAFKALTPEAAVDAHADEGAVTINFWLTPDAANLAPERGGLTVCRFPPPPDWQLKGYNADIARVAALMEQHSADSLVVPYRENRAVLFESRLFHRADAPHFANGYEAHRISVTMLFGCHES